MYKILIITFLFFCNYSFSQDTVLKIRLDSIIEKNNTKLTDSTKLKDTIDTLEFINADLSLEKDHLFAKQLDELWFKELDSLFYEEIKTDSINYSDELTSSILKERLAFLDSKTPFYVTYNPQLEALIKRFLKHRKKSYATFMARAKFYFPLIEEQLAKYHIPLEMKYLVVVESALNPLAKSSVGATGLWQFMYQTGQQFGLKVSSYVDERSDVLKSTEAACKYLSKLYAIFKDWDLALAAYNSGPGNVTKAIRRSGSKNYWNLRGFLPRETANYVPLFYTTMYLFEFSDKHHIQPKEISIQYYQTDTLQVRKQITFEQIEKATSMDKKLLRFLNPQYFLGVIPVVKNRNYTLRLPTNYIGKFVQNEERIYQFAEADALKREKPLPKYTELNNRIRYKVKNGDFLGKIARKYGVSVKKIMRWNGMRNTKLKIGQRLIIYPRRF
ncbi:MAG TPA: LysM peptidoglycan-binding domain-containing protein [Flavobacteriia bacterium]|nr:LysM peptidoglycan-binding domain-containing protein [Flavobacteriia bacterium]